ncbi:hypothetical protein Q0N71_23180 [Bacillus thuringiensis]|uniref:hypothetical protein n=1 Tax=Bacillus thuringiensis TaxID=1428 RepID=UPI00345A09CF
MKRNIKELINKYLYEKDRSSRVMFFPINLYLMSSNSGESSTFDKILKEITEDIFYILLGSIDASDSDMGF